MGRKAVEVNLHEYSIEDLFKIRATEITKNFDSVADIYSHKHKKTSNEIQVFLDYLLELNKDKKVYVIWDNAGPHTASNVESYAYLHRKRLKIINLPPHSPELNPQ